MVKVEKKEGYTHRIRHLVCGCVVFVSSAATLEASQNFVAVDSVPAKVGCQGKQGSVYHAQWWSVVVVLGNPQDGTYALVNIAA